MVTPPPDLQNFQRDVAIRELAKKSLVLGLLSLFCCALCAPFAISYANKTDAMIREANSGISYGSSHKTGRILGYVALVFLAVGIVAQVVVFLGRS